MSEPKSPPGVATVIRAVIIDDEPLAAENLRHLVAGISGIRLVGLAANATAARELLLEARPDLAFLDVRMPRGSGFDVLRSLQPADRPVVVVVTAYDSHAIEAFDIEAVDYLEKPVGPRRLAVALERVRSRLGQRSQLAQTPSTLVQLCEGPTPLFALRDDIISIKAAGRHCLIRTRESAVRVRSAMTLLLARLDARWFVRIHRSAIVQLSHVRELKPARHGDLDARMSDGSVLRVSRRYRRDLETALKHIESLQ